MADASMRMTGAMTRRKVLALSASGVAGVALAACGGSTNAPTATPAPAAAAPTVTGPAATATAVPQSLGGATTPAGNPATTGTAASGAASPSAAASTANLADKQVFRFADVEPPSFDPANCQNPVNEPQVFEGLVTVSWKDGMIEPAMAQSYQANADATVWTFKMRPGMKWSDGTPLTAKDFEYAWRRVMEPEDRFDLHRLAGERQERPGDRQGRAAAGPTRREGARRCHLRGHAEHARALLPAPRRDLDMLPDAPARHREVRAEVDGGGEYRRQRPLHPEGVEARSGPGIRAEPELLGAEAGDHPRRVHPLR